MIEKNDVSRAAEEKWRVQSADGAQGVVVGYDIDEQFVLVRFDGATATANMDRRYLERVLPKRIRLSRAKGWRKPKGAVVVARNTKWGNPFKVGDPGPGSAFMDAADVCRCFEQYTLPGLPVAELRGKDLACWCPLDAPCHADILLKHANKGSAE